MKMTELLPLKGYLFKGCLAITVIFSFQTASALIDALYPEVSPYVATYVLVVTWSDYKKSGQSVLVRINPIL